MRALALRCCAGVGALSSILHPRRLNRGCLRSVRYDDAMVREVGAKWSDVVARCRAGKWQPQLLV
jgi:hypothetical protein